MMKQDLEFAKLGEEWVSTLLSQVGCPVTDVRNDSYWMDKDVDYITTGFIFPREEKLEVKTDRFIDKTSNYVYEFYSFANDNLSKVTPGCFEKTEADYILYCRENSQIVDVLNMKRFRSYIKGLRKNNVPLKDMGDHAKGYVINEKEINDNGIVICSYKWNAEENKYVQCFNGC